MAGKRESHSDKFIKLKLLLHKQLLNPVYTITDFDCGHGVDMNKAVRTHNVQVFHFAISYDAPFYKC